MKDFLPLLPTTLAILSAGSGLIAAFNWYRSSQVSLPDYHSAPVGEYGPVAYNWMKETSKLNKMTALWTATATGLAAASAIAGVLISWPKCPN